jgi:polyisoprenoid-binding protein YceI
MLVVAALAGLALFGGGLAYLTWLTSPVEFSHAVPAAPSLSIPGSADGKGADGTGGAHSRLYHLDPARSEASYSAEEKLLSGGADTPVKRVGTTQAVAGDILLNDIDVGASKIGEIVVDISQLTSGDQMRDNALRRQWLESSKFPLATFRSARLEGCPTAVREGQLFTCRLSGELTIHGITQSATWVLEAQLRDNNLTGSATTEIKMSSFGVQLPEIMGTLKVLDDTDLKLDFVAVPGEAATGTQPDR